MTRLLAAWHPCECPGPAWGHCGNRATHAVRFRDGRPGIWYWCDLHVADWHPYPGHENDLEITPLAPEVTP